MITVHSAITADQIDVARELIPEYAALPHVAGRWLDAEREIAELPGAYAPPRGVILLASQDGKVLGCGCLRPFDEPGACEMKRLYVRPDARRRGVGEILIRALVDEANALGYFTMKLDTAPELTTAQSLYHRLGFTRIPHYHDRLLPDDVCFQRWLA